eukprot:54765-Prymnesium_polylepis.2
MQSGPACASSRSTSPHAPATAVSSGAAASTACAPSCGAALSHPCRTSWSTCARGRRFFFERDDCSGSPSPSQD